MKGILFYFSGTGNTKWVADKFKERFNFYGSELELVNIEKEPSYNMEEYGFMIIGTSIYAGCGPKIMDEFINNMPAGNGKMKCILYSTQGAKTCAATSIYGNILQSKGYEVLIKAMIQMPNNYYFLNQKQADSTQNDAILESASKKVKELTGDFIQNNSVNESAGKIGSEIGKLSSKFFKKWLPKMSENLTSTDECTKCSYCLNNCPAGNITFENGRAVFHSKCIMCLRCIHGCPVNAIRYKGKKVEQTQKEIIKSLELR